MGKYTISCGELDGEGRDSGYQASIAPSLRVDERLVLAEDPRTINILPVLVTNSAQDEVFSFDSYRLTVGDLKDRGVLVDVEAKTQMLVFSVAKRLIDVLRSAGVLVDLEGGILTEGLMVGPVSNKD